MVEQQMNESRVSNWRNQRYAQMLENGIGADVHFLVGRVGEEKQLISANKFMLSAASDVFEGQFFRFTWMTGTPEGSEEKQIELTDVGPDAFHVLLSFIYTESTNGVNKQNVLDVYDAGKKYKVNALVEKCRQLLMDNGDDDDQQNYLGMDNLLSVLELAKRHRDNDLLDHCLAFMENNADVYFLVGKPGEEKHVSLIPANKFMLSAVSQVFDGQFSRFNEITGTEEGSKEQPIEVPDVGPDAFRALLWFIYTKDLGGVNRQNVLDVY